MFDARACLVEALEVSILLLSSPTPDIQTMWESDDQFHAELALYSCGFTLSLTTGLAVTVFDFWDKQLKGNEHQQRLEQSNDERLCKITRYGLMWLMLHELSHINLGHFSLGSSYGIAQRSNLNPYTHELFPDSQLLYVTQCLEMQADHEATDTLLGTYSAEVWHEVREKVLAISGMMMLIELEDAKNNAESLTHPKAATRIFQLLGHVAEMPLVRAQVHQDASLIPSEEELQAFTYEVTIPCFFDAIQLAKAAGAASIADDLGNPEDFFKDLEIAKLGDPSRYGELKIQGAQEWAKLWPCNEALKPILGGHFTN